MGVMFDTRYLFVRSMKKLVRTPILLFFSLFQPIIFLVLFTQLFSRFANLPGFPASTYLLFATPGIVLQNAFSSAFQSGTAVVDDIKSGMLEKMLATPISRSAILLGRVLSDAVRVVAQSIIILALAFLLGAFPATGVPGLLLMLLTIAFFGLAWAGISLSLGLKTKNAESVFAIAGFLTLTRKGFAALFVLASVVGGVLISQTMKWAYARPRPELVPHGAEVYTASFPSGHSMMSAVVYLTLGALLARTQADRAVKTYVLVMAVILTVLVGVSRVYLGVHWPTDVLAGWALGGAWALICLLVMTWLQTRGQVEDGAAGRAN